MAAASLSVSDPSNDRSGVNIHFVDEDELPLAHFVERRVSEEELQSDEYGRAMDFSRSVFSKCTINFVQE